MKNRRVIDLLIFTVATVLCAMSFFYLTGWVQWLSCLAAGCLAICFLVLSLQKRQWSSPTEDIPPEPATAPSGIVTELALLNEEDEAIATWEMHGKTSMVIGRDVGENHVTVNLSKAIFSSMIDREHAVLNYSNGNWYVEDLGSKNGISVVKSDGRRYRLASDKACLVCKGDMLLIAMTKLLLR